MVSPSLQLIAAVHWTLQPSGELHATRQLSQVTRQSPRQVRSQLPELVQLMSLFDPVVTVQLPTASQRIRLLEPAVTTQSAAPVQL